MNTKIGGVRLNKSTHLEFNLVQQIEDEYVEMQIDGKVITLNMAQVQQLKVIMSRCSSALEAAGESRLHKANLGLF